MEDELITSLENEFNCPVIRQGSMGADEEYPARFFTFWNRRSAYDAFYDDEAHAEIYTYDLNFYSSNFEEISTILRTAVKLLKKSGWVSSGPGHDVASDEDTHLGKGITVTKKIYTN